MKINEVISVKRRELGLTQEQIALTLNVSTPAVNKWESGKSLPDISLLPALARLLKTDLNTLLSFQEELTDLELAQFVNEIGEEVFKIDYDVVFEKAMNRIKEFPNNDKLKYSLVTILSGSITMFPTPNKEIYLEKMNQLLLQCVTSSDLQISNYALQMLSINACQAGDFKKAEEYLNKIIDFSINKTALETTILTNEKKYEDALEKLEKRLLSDAVNIQNFLSISINTLIELERFEEAEYFLKTLERHSEIFNLMPTHVYIGAYRIAIKQKNKDQAIANFEKILELMIQPWNIEDSILYANIKKKEGFVMNEDHVKVLIDSLETDEDFDFIRDDPRFEEIVKRYQQA